MKLKIVPASRGLLWVRQGLRVFFKRPLGFCLLFFIFMLLGPPLMLAVAPLATIGFMLATQEALQGRFPAPTVFVTPLRVDRTRMWAQIKLGLAYAACTLIVYLLSSAVDGGALQSVNDAMNAGKSPSEIEPLMSDPRLMGWWLILVGGVSLLAAPFWFAPALVHWAGMSAMKSVFFSTVACWRNKGAFVVYTLGWTAVVMLFALASGIIFALLGTQQLALAAIMPAALMLSAAFYASLYFTFTDCFEPAVPTEGALKPDTLETP